MNTISKCIKKENIINCIKIVEDFDNIDLSIKLNGYDAIVYDKLAGIEYKCKVGDYVLLQEKIQVIAKDMFDRLYLSLEQEKYSRMELDLYLIKWYDYKNNLDKLRDFVKSSVGNKSIYAYTDNKNIIANFYNFVKNINITDDSLYHLLKLLGHPDFNVFNIEVREAIKEYMYALMKEKRINVRVLANGLGMDYQKLVRHLNKLDCQTLYKCISFTKTYQHMAV